MATEEDNSVAAQRAHVIGNAFVEQYYHVLHSSPTIVYKFYQDSSLLTRPATDGTMKMVTTMDAINELILSLNYEDYRAEIHTADAQKSHNGGVIVLVTGCLTGLDNVPKKFTQTFFLAPQDNGGFYVRNDVLRFVEEKSQLERNSELPNVISETAPMAPLTPDPVPSQVPNHHQSDSPFEEEEDLDNVPEVCDPSDNEGSVIEVEVVEPSTHLGQTDQTETLTTIEPAHVAEDDAPKKSYASILKVMRSSTTSAPIYVPTSTARQTTTNAERHSLGSAKPAPQTKEVSAPIIESASENNNAREEVEGYSIYIKNLPLNATVDLVAEAFKKFGPIKRNGIQVRTNKGFCFGFVEFESLSSMQEALETSPITIGDRLAEIEEKRTTTRVGSGGGGRGRFPSGRGGFRNDNFRSRGNFGGGGGGRGHGRNEFRNQGEFAGRPRGGGPARNNGDGYQRVNHNGIGREEGRQAGPNRNTVPV